MLIFSLFRILSIDPSYISIRNMFFKTGGCVTTSVFCLYWLLTLLYGQSLSSYPLVLVMQMKSSWFIKILRGSSICHIHSYNSTTQCNLVSVFNPNGAVLHSRLIATVLLTDGHSPIIGISPSLTSEPNVAYCVDIICLLATFHLRRWRGRRRSYSTQQGLKTGDCSSSVWGPFGPSPGVFVPD